MTPVASLMRPLKYDLNGKKPKRMKISHTSPFSGADQHHSRVLLQRHIIWNPTSQIHFVGIWQSKSCRTTGRQNSLFSRAVIYKCHILKTSATAMVTYLFTTCCPRKVYTPDVISVRFLKVAPNGLAYMIYLPHPPHSHKITRMHIIYLLDYYTFVI